MMIPSEVTIVTGNEKKWIEIQAILKGDDDRVKLSRANLDLPEIQGNSIESIAKWKCCEAARLVKGPVITEDTALCFDAMNGLPGPYIKWFLEGLGLTGLYNMLKGFPTKTAKAICTMAYCAGPNCEPILFQGITTGSIVEPRGASENFGWDPIFQPDNHPSSFT